METKNSGMRSILLIDDDKDDYELVLEALREIDADISVSFINTSEDAKRHVGKKFDLVLLDINMPVWDGFKWLRSIREQGHTSLPIVMYTNSRSPAHIAKAYEEGANLFFAKPESFPSLIKGLRTLINLDWSDPFSITVKYKQQGNYQVFTA